MAKTKTTPKDADQPASEAGDDEEAAGAAGGTPQDNLSPKTRPRSKSDRFARPTRKLVVDVYKQVSFSRPKEISHFVFFLFENKMRNSFKKHCANT